MYSRTACYKKSAGQNQNQSEDVHDPENHGCSFTAKYRLTFQDGSVKTVHDKGVMKNAFYSNSQIVVEQSESQFTLRDQNFGQERLRSQKIVNQTRKYVRKGKAEKAETSCWGGGFVLLSRFLTAQFLCNFAS